MLMNKRKYQRLFPLLLLAAVSMAVLAVGAEQETTKPGTPSTDQPEERSTEAAEAVSESPQPVEQTPSADAASPRVIREFKPTEKIEADSAVSFPIDI